MIVIAIIGILSASLFPKMSSYMARSRDTARIADLQKIKLALFSYYQDTGKYVAEGGISSDSSQWIEATFLATGVGRMNWEAGVGGGLKTLEWFYIPKLPVDPVNKWTLFYLYEPVDNQTQFGVTCTGAGNTCAYIISAKMENSNNAQADLTTCNLLGIGHDYCLGAGLPNIKE